MSSLDGSVTFREVIGVREFAGLWVTWVMSVMGDQVARVALSLLVFDRTGSPALTALTYAVTFVPDILGGPLLASLADRFPRRRVMVVADVVRALLVGVMAIPGMPVGALIALLFGVQTVSVPFTAARVAMTRAMLSESQFALGNSVMQTTYQIGLVAGFPLGALAFTALGADGALLVDAATFVGSALLIRIFIVERRAQDAPDGKPRTTWSAIRGGFQLLKSSPKHRALLALAAVAGFYVAAEGLVVPYASQIGGGAVAVGLLLAANPVGTAIGMIVLGKIKDARTRARWLGPLAVATCLMLVPTAFAPGIVVTLVLWTLVGIFSAHDLVTSTEYINATSDHQRGMAMGIATAVMRGAQGVGVVIGGVVAEWLDPARVIALLAAVGVIAAMLAARAWRRVITTPSPQHDALSTGQEM